MSRTSRAAIWVAAGIAALVLLVVAAGVVLVRTQWFHDRVRDRIVSDVERVSGGRAGIGSFQFDWKTLTAKVSPFVLHGKEAAGEAAASGGIGHGWTENRFHPEARYRYRIPGAGKAARPRDSASGRHYESTGA